MQVRQQTPITARFHLSPKYRWVRNAIEYLARLRLFRLRIRYHQDRRREGFAMPAPLSTFSVKCKVMNLCEVCSRSSCSGNYDGLPWDTFSIILSTLGLQ